MSEPHTIPTKDQRDRDVAASIKRGECPFHMLKPGQTMAHCPLGFPGCSCADELMLNPYLREETLARLEAYDEGGTT